MKVYELRITCNDEVTTTLYEEWKDAEKAMYGEMVNDLRYHWEDCDVNDVEVQNEIKWLFSTLAERICEYELCPAMAEVVPMLTGVKYEIVEREVL